MQSLVSSLEQKIDETEKKFEETKKISEERLKKALDAENKIDNLKTAMHKYALLVFWLLNFLRDIKAFFIHWQSTYVLFLHCSLEEKLKEVKFENNFLKESVLTTPVKTASGRFLSTPLKVDMPREIFGCLHLTLSIILIIILLLFCAVLVNYVFPFLSTCIWSSAPFLNISIKAVFAGSGVYNTAKDTRIRIWH